VIRGDGKAPENKKIEKKSEGREEKQAKTCKCKESTQKEP
jgi:hypothetical protein